MPGPTIRTEVGDVLAALMANSDADHRQVADDLAEHSRNFRQRLAANAAFTTAGPPVTADLAKAIHEILLAAPDVSQVRWHFEDAFMRGSSDGAADPFAPT